MNISAQGMTDKAVSSIQTGYRPIKHEVKGKSLTARARNSVLQFPVFITDRSIRVNEAHTISKFFERAYTTLVQTVIAQYPVLDEEEANNLVFLRQFHTNITEEAKKFMNEYYTPIDECDRIICESAYRHVKISDNFEITFSAINPTNTHLLEENARQLNEPLTGFWYLQEAPGGVKDDPTLKTTTNTTTTKDAIYFVTDKVIKFGAERRAENDKTYADKVMVDGKLDMDKVKELLKAGGDEGSLMDNKGYYIKYDNASGRYITNQGKVVTSNDSSRSTLHPTVPAPTILREADIKKINGMQPYTIQVSFRIKFKNGDTAVVSYVIGVKTVLHRINSKDLLTEIPEVIAGNSEKLQNIRYKTGEITIWEKLFNTQSIKKSISRMLKGNVHLPALRRLGEFDKLNKSYMGAGIMAIQKGKEEIPLPNGTLVISQEDVLDIKQNSGIDIEKIKTAKQIAKNLFLITIAIVDSGSGTMKILQPDKDTQWDVQSLAAIDTDVNKLDNSPLKRELNKMYSSNI